MFNGLRFKVVAIREIHYVEKVKTIQDINKNHHQSPNDKHEKSGSSSV